MKYFFFALLICASACQQDSNVYTLISPLEGEVLESCCLSFSWEQTEKAKTNLQIFKDSTLNLASLVYEEEIKSQQRMIPDALFPGKKYWFKLSGGGDEIVSSFETIDNLSSLPGTYDVKIEKRLSGLGEPSETWYSELVVTVLTEEEQLYVTEPKTSLAITLNFSNVLVGNTVTEFRLDNEFYLVYSNNPQIETYITLIAHPNGSDNWPLTFYNSRY